MNLNIKPATLLSEWSVEWIKQILDQNVAEGYLYDFKKEISSKDQTLSSAVASFANTVGRFIIFGIIDSQNATGWDRLHGINNKREL